MRPYRNFRLSVWFPYLALSILLAVVIFGGAARVFAALPAQIGLPVHGWTVCADLGVGPVPGLPASVQRLRLCQGSGWEVQAYCLNPQQPAPALGSACSMLNDTDFWCGDSVQQLRNYQLLQTPAPSSTPLPSSTPSPLPSPTATVTPLPSLTPTLPLPSETVEVTPPSGGFDTPGPGPSPTLFERPYPGGEGLRAPLFSALSLLAGFGLLGAAFWLARRG